MEIKRYKNFWFWVGIFGVIFTAVNIDPHTFTSWSIAFQSFTDVLSNPAKLVPAILAVAGVFTNPTTKGLSDPK